jgi:hypothetical protein
VSCYVAAPQSNMTYIYPSMETVEVKALPFCSTRPNSSVALASRAHISLQSSAQLTSTSYRRFLDRPPQASGCHFVLARRNNKMEATRIVSIYRTAARNIVPLLLSPIYVSRRLRCR